MSITRTARSIRHVLLIAAGLALLVMPAAAAVSAQNSAETAAGGSLVADGAITEAPAVADSGASAATEDASGSASADAPGLDGADTSAVRATESQGAAASVPTDQSDSTEAFEVKRSCGAEADPHYVPASGTDSKQCYDSDGKFRSSRSYTATHYTNDVKCGRQNMITGNGAADVWVFGAAGTDGGYASICSDGFSQVHGRATASADADGSATVVLDGDKDNPEETTQGWVSGTVSSDGPEYRCGKSYEDGGRGTADAPTSEDNADQCSP